MGMVRAKDLRLTIETYWERLIHNDADEGKEEKENEYYAELDAFDELVKKAELLDKLESLDAPRIHFRRYKDVASLELFDGAGEILDSYAAPTIAKVLEAIPK